MMDTPLGAVQRFPLGQLVITPGAGEALDACDHHPWEFLARHACGDWGQLCEHDRQENERSVRQGSRLLSAYVLRDGERLWIITESDRSVTTLLLPQEY